MFRSQLARKLFRRALLLSSILILAAEVCSLRAATVVVPGNGDFQAELYAANCGDTIVLQAGALAPSSSPFVWEKVASAPINIKTITVIGQNLYLGTNSGIYSSTDGVTWTQLTGTNPSGLAPVHMIGTAQG